MATIILNRIDNLNSKFVFFNINLDGKYDGTIGNNSKVYFEDIQIGNHIIYVSNLKGIYRSKKLHFTINKIDEIRYFETGPNTSLENIFPLSVLAPGLITIRADYIKEIKSHQAPIINTKIGHQDIFDLSKIWNFLILVIPAIYIFINKIGYPEYIQLVINVVLMLGSVFTLLIRFNKINIPITVQLKEEYFLTYTLLMAFITSDNYFLLLYNLLVVAYILIKNIIRFLKFPD